MTFVHRAPGTPKRLGILAGSFNPPTRAHLALAQAARRRVDEVLFALPRAFPHKPYQDASFEQRVQMLETALAGERHCSLAVTDGGLFIEIARECRAAYPSGVELYFICGRDAAERIVNWDYGRPGAIEQQLSEYQLLVAPRGGIWEPPAGLRDRIHWLTLPPGYEEISASEVRERIRQDLPWRHLAPERIVELIQAVYGSRPAR